MTAESYYQILRVSPEADAETIKRAYRKLAQIYHPDKRTNKKFAEHKFKMLNEAYSILSDAEKRAEYDAENGFEQEERAQNEAENDSAKEDYTQPKGIWVEGVGDAADAAFYRNGERHGKWEMRYSDGSVHIGEFAKGKRHGFWMEKDSDGDVGSGDYVDGKSNGQWIWRFANGTVAEGPVVDGKRHGKWETRFADGDVHEGPYVYGEKNGHWVERNTDGTLDEGPFMNGQRQGDWIFRFADGSVAEGLYVDGEQHGQWIFRSADGDMWYEAVYDMGEEKEVWEEDGSDTEGHEKEGRISKSENEVYFRVGYHLAHIWMEVSKPENKGCFTGCFLPLSLLVLIVLLIVGLLF